MFHMISIILIILNHNLINYIPWLIMNILYKKTHCDTILLESQQDNAEVVKANNLARI
jgi:hypothetical protein